MAAVAESVAETQPLEIAKNRATTETELAVSAGAAGSSGLGKQDTTVDAVTAVAKSVCEARPLEIAKHSTFTESELAVSSREAGDTTSAAATTATQSVAEAQPSEIAMHSATSPGEAGSSGSRAGGTTRVVEVPKESVDVFAQRCRDGFMKLFDARRETPSRFVERIRERCERELAIAAGEGFSSFSGVRIDFFKTQTH